MRVCYLHDIDLLHLAFIKDLARCRVFDLARLNWSNFLADVQQPCFAIDAAVGKHNRIAFHVTLGVVSVRHFARELIQLGRADRAD